MTHEKDLTRHNPLPTRFGTVGGGHNPIKGRGTAIQGNRIEILGSFAVIYLNDGYFVVVDAKFAARVEQFTWCKRTRLRHNLIYAVTNRGKDTQIYLHQVILKAPPGKEIDHIDGNGLNNTMANLRAVTHQENIVNMNKDKPIFHVTFGIPEWVKNG